MDTIEKEPLDISFPPRSISLISGREPDEQGRLHFESASNRPRRSPLPLEAQQRKLSPMSPPRLTRHAMRVVRLDANIGLERRGVLQRRKELTVERALRETRYAPEPVRHPRWGGAAFLVPGRAEELDHARADFLRRRPLALVGR